MALPFPLAVPAFAMGNLCDLYTQVHTEDAEGAEVTIHVRTAEAVACSIQPATPTLQETLGLVGTRASDVVYFAADPGLVADDQIQRTDAPGQIQRTDAPGPRLSVIRVQDRGGLGVLWLAACVTVE
jgi:hypothetical protein